MLVSEGGRKGGRRVSGGRGWQAKACRGFYLVLLNCNLFTVFPCHFPAYYVSVKNLYYNVYLIHVHLNRSNKQLLQESQLI